MYPARRFQAKLPTRVLPASRCRRSRRRAGRRTENARNVREPEPPEPLCDPLSDQYRQTSGDARTPDPRLRWEAAAPDSAASRRPGSAPRSGVGRELAVRRAHAGIAVEGAEPHARRRLRGRVYRPQGRAAGRAEGLPVPVQRLVDANELRARSKLQRARHDSGLGRSATAGSPLAAGAVAIPRRQRRLGHLEADASAEAATFEWERGVCCYRQRLVR